MEALTRESIDLVIQDMLWCSATQCRRYPSRSTCRARSIEFRSACPTVDPVATGARSSTESGEPASVTIEASMSTLPFVAYDEELAARVRDLVAGERGVTEQKMFGGLAFLVGGNMAVAASGQGGILVRVDPEESDALVSKTGAETMVMRGRKMRGWLRVGSEQVGTKRTLEPWVKRGVSYARSLPPK